MPASTVGELGPGWLARQQGHLKPSAFRPLEVAWRTRVKPRWGHVALGDLRPSDVQAWLSEMSQGTADARAVGATVVTRTHQVFSAILTDAVRDHIVANNPAVGMKLPRKPRKRRCF